jgi:hypothetical protein
MMKVPELALPVLVVEVIADPGSEKVNVTVRC